MKKIDAAIIGFGKGGKTLAGALAAAGKQVAVVERSDQMYGGTCINVGCIPTKSLVHSAEASDAQGGTFEEKSARYAAAIAEKRRLTGMLRKKNFDKLNDLPNVDVMHGTASFTGPHTLSVQTAEGREEIEAEQIFINTGARPFIPPIPGLQESAHMYVSESLMDLETLPKKLVIIGGGYIGMEFASIYANFGSSVTVIQDGPVFLPREDEEIAREVLKSLTDRGMRVLPSAQVASVRDQGDRAVLSVQTETGAEDLEADAILVATGRHPNLEDLHPEAAGVELTQRGAVQTDQFLRTTVPHIWAMGDVAGGLQFTYISLDDFRIVKSQLLGDGSRSTKNRGAVPYSVFLDPPFSRVGLSEREAREQGYDVKIAKLPVAAIPKAQVLRKTTGLLKVVIDAKTNQILGAHLFCEESHEVINLIKLAIDAKLPYTVLRDSIYTHPTMSESLNDLFASVQ
ncbi:FAD-dependent oxidoreductase [Clostridium sp. D33t1_170424_F3]|uniref:FAD-dependent oxidoreductase n=1 Tax=Clostridium sp. D33t1_170424_F3 TaxID=2787099 RepID=UPI0018AA13AC|nr:FAD-dependent oxidoreductase [Clostridium sp. D33t1_170424_F3]